VRENLVALMAISLVINVGMWLERFVILMSTAHDFLPSSWGHYRISLTEAVAMVGSFAWFFMLFALFAKHLPSVAMGELKELRLHVQHGASEGDGR
jgi:molybdopterin-containing oxidoreductase family membrane subunit